MPLGCEAFCHHSKIQSIAADTKHTAYSLIFKKLDDSNTGLEKILGFFSLYSSLYTPLLKAMLLKHLFLLFVFS